LLIGKPEQLFTKQGPAFRWGLVGGTLPGHEPARHRDSEIFAAQAGEFATTRRQTGTARAPPINNLFRPALLTPIGSRGALLCCGWRLWRHSNYSFVPSLEPRISIYVERNVRFTFVTGLGCIL